MGQKADIGIRMVRYCPVEGMSVILMSDEICRKVPIGFRL